MNTMQITAPYFTSTFLSPGRAINTVFTSIWFSDLMHDAPTYRCYALVVLSEARASLYVTIFSWNLNVAMKHEALSRLVCVRHASFAACVPSMLFKNCFTRFSITQFAPRNRRETFRFVSERVNILRCTAIACIN